MTTPESPVLQGGCYCREIRYEVDLPLGRASHCHCEDCRRSHSSAFVSWTSAPRESVRFLLGRDRLSQHESHPGVRWGFCSRCGTSFHYESDAEPGVIYLTLASLDDAARAPRPVAHLSAEERAPWIEGQEGLPIHRGKTSELVGDFEARLVEQALVDTVRKTADNEIISDPGWFKVLTPSAPTPYRNGVYRSI